jgi:hypothetical protein
MTDNDLALARRYMAAHRQTLRMFRHYEEEPPDEEPVHIEWDEEALDQELAELESELE